MLHESRIRILNDKPVRPEAPFVLYWMQQSQRTRLNHALEAAIRKANQLDLPLVVLFGLMDDYPEATLRHYTFMLEGLADVARELAGLGATFITRRGHPKELAVALSADAACVVTDRAYLRHLRGWRDHLADHSPVRVVEVDTDLVVPVDLPSQKPEIGARTLRPRIHRLWKDFLVDCPLSALKHKKDLTGTRASLKSDFDPLDLEGTLKNVHCDRSVGASPIFRGGPREAEVRLASFLKSKLPGYAEGRNEPYAGQTSGLSPYLQYGQISPIRLALAAAEFKQHAVDFESFVEELIVRRELSHNHCLYNPRYDAYEGLPEWAKRSLAKHASDPREQVYSREQLESASTHDRYWNAAQAEMVLTGYMHNYMRMYWGKKILEWSKSPEEAFATTLAFNNRYFLDGLNANSYGNVGWIFGLHDRPWIERPIFGQIRYMNDKGLERKFDIDRYVTQIDDLARTHTGRPISKGLLV